MRIRKEIEDVLSTIQVRGIFDVLKTLEIQSCTTELIEDLISDETKTSEGLEIVNFGI